MKTVENRGGADRRAVGEALEALQSGHVIIYPTDTLYAFACDALNSRAIERLCRIKGINPDKNCLSIVCSDISQAAEYARIDNRAFRLLKDALPGAYTFILPAATTLPKAFKGRKSVGVRIPDCEFARALAAELGHPVLTSSVPLGDDDIDRAPDGATLALRYGGNSEIALTIDGGEGSTEPSTVIDLTDSSSPELIRAGAAPFDL
ncbi:MAG: L-threonylcarbamoyladenylate synthase [Muribaculaceae bacterium]|nr:L-threonylcarbamoyladenylate synthase [Muribaculaceae bacterium]